MDFLDEHKEIFDTALADFAGFKGFPEQILESAVEAAVIIDNQKRIVYVSGGYQKMTGQLLDEIRWQDMSVLKISNFEAIDQVLSHGIRRTGIPTTIGSQRIIINMIPVKTKMKMNSPAMQLLLLHPLEALLR